MDFLPIRVEGLSLYSKVEVVLYIFVVSKIQTWVLQDHILKDSDIYSINSDFDRFLNGLSGTIPYFDLSNFISKNIAPLKSNMFRRLPFLVKKV